jgi:ankyrin repeat protein
MKRTPMHLAADSGNLELPQKLWEWGKETLTAEELNNKLLLAKDSNQQTVWHYVSRRGNAVFRETVAVG